jgi:hypothetical protein
MDKRIEHAGNTGGCLARKLDLAERFLCATREMKDQIAKGEIGNIRLLIIKRRSLMDEMDRMDMILRNMKTPEAPGDRDRFRGLRREIRRTLEEASRMTGPFLETLASGLRGLQDEILGTVRKRGEWGGYGQRQSPASPRFMDIKS